MPMLHPDGSTIEPIRSEGARFTHVVRHLYRQEERWDLLISALPSGLRRRAIEAGCGAAALRWKQPDFERAGQPCRDLILRDHDRFYAPEYAAAIEHGRVTPNRWGAWESPEGPRHLFVGANGVLALVAPGSPSRRGSPHVLRTAYRCRPRGIPTHQATQDDFAKAAVRTFLDKTSLLVEPKRGTP